jgi:hypothetical protein
MTTPAAAPNAKPKAKKATAKPAAKTAAGKSAPKAEGKPDPVFTEWKKGARISELVKTHKLSRSEIRRRLVAAAGGRDAFRALRKAGAGGPTGKGTATPHGERS